MLLSTTPRTTCTWSFMIRSTTAPSSSTSIRTSTTSFLPRLLFHSVAILMVLTRFSGGEEVMLDVAGQDGTEAFEDVGHSDEAREALDKLFVGELKRLVSDSSETPFMGRTPQSLTCPVYSSLVRRAPSAPSSTRTRAPTLAKALAWVSTPSLSSAVSLPTLAISTSRSRLRPSRLDPHERARAF